MSAAHCGRYGLLVRFEVLSGHEEAFDRLTAETLVATRSSEIGTLAYVVHRDAESPGARVFYELYRDEAAFRVHESMPHVRRFLAERAQYLGRDPTVWRMIQIAGVVRPEADLPDV
jgi:quinol monooxygenase YgiN